MIEPGWTALYPRGKQDQDNGEDDESQALPQFTPGERGPHEPSIKRGETTPPKPYTENTLLGAMETAGKLVDDEQLREMLKEKGLGTPATRAAIIETLLKRKYIERQKKTLIATDLGRYLIAVVENPELKSPELTGQWEGKLREIESGRLDPQRFMAEIAEYTRRIVSREDAAAVDESQFGDCPRCGKPVIQGKRGFGCSGWRDGCSFVLWPEYKGQTLSAADIRQLLQQRVLMRPMRIEGGGEVILTLTATGQLGEIPLPSKSQQTGGRRQRSAQKSFRGRSKSGRGRAPAEPAAGAGAGSRFGLGPGKMSRVRGGGSRAAEVVQLQRRPMPVRDLEDDRRQADHGPHRQDTARPRRDVAARRFSIQSRQIVLGAAQADRRPSQVCLRPGVADLFRERIWQKNWGRKIGISFGHFPAPIFLPAIPAAVQPSSPRANRSHRPITAWRPETGAWQAKFSHR